MKNNCTLTESIFDIFSKRTSLSKKEYKKFFGHKKLKEVELIRKIIEAIDALWHVN